MLNGNAPHLRIHDTSTPTTEPAKPPHHLAKRGLGFQACYADATR